MITRTCQERAVSEIIGTIILITLFVAAAAILMMLVLSQPQPGKIPAFNTIITNDSRVVRLYHAGGDSVPYSDFYLLIDGTQIPFSGEGGDGVWSIGETLTAVSPDMPNNVQLVFNLGTGQQLLVSRLLGT